MRFEDLRVWQVSRELTKPVYEMARSHDLSRDYALRDQMRRAAISSMSNFAEGYERDGNRELRQFLSVAKGSVGELRSQFYVALDVGYLSDTHFQALYKTSSGVSRMLSALIDRPDRSNFKGRKLK